MKTTKETKEIERKEESKLKELSALWLHESKSGLKYLSGNLSAEFGSSKLVAYFNTNKKNPKEPDIRIYTLDQEGKQDTEIISLWENISKNDKRYLTGLTNEKEKVVGFYGNENEEKRPYVRVYLDQE